MSNPEDSPNRCMICDSPCTGDYCPNCEEVHKSPEAAKKPTLLIICLPTDWESRVLSGSRIVKCEYCHRNIWVRDDGMMRKKAEKGAVLICVPCAKKGGAKI